MINNTPVVVTEIIIIGSFSSNIWASQNIPQFHSSLKIKVDVIANISLNNSQPQIKNLPSIGLQLPLSRYLLPKQIDLIRKLHIVKKLNYQYICVVAYQGNWNYI